MKRVSFLLMIAFFFWAVAGAGSFSPAWTQPVSSQWTVSSGTVQAWTNESLPEQFFRHDGQLFAVDLSGGQLVIYQCIDNQWVEYQRFSAKGHRFTAVWVNERSSRPEIIAGTDEPGFLYIFTMDEQSQWNVCDNHKYLWSNITHIASGTFTGAEETEYIVQNSEGSLFYLKRERDTLNIVWKSPSPWRHIRFLRVVDIDGDAIDEILVSYQNGSMAVLKVEKNAVVTKSEHYPWGRVLAVHFGDWNQDRKPGFMVTTSQMVNYILCFSDNSYKFSNAMWQSNYLIENLQFVSGKTPQFMASDSSGHTHILEYNPSQKRWNEIQTISTGRIAQIIPQPDGQEFWLLGYNRQFTIISKNETP